MADLGLAGELGGKWDNGLCVGLDVLPVGNLNRGAIVGVVDICTMLLGGGIKVMAGSASVDDGSVICEMGMLGWDYSSLI